MGCGLIAIIVGMKNNTNSNDETITKNLEKNDIVIRKLVRAAARAFAELNAIRARDGVPYTRDGYKYSVDEQYFSSVIDELDESVKAATGRSAHCHPELYT